jgi:DNA invertase Pin-like site-specific DNA recombinase
MPAETIPSIGPEMPQRVCAAQYVRMSTEHQQYSTENQGDAIRDYAAKRGYEVVRTYADDGKSGLRIEGRNALKQLIADVQNGQTNFEAILVYDISRWGRFQDSDESAYYEYVCKRAGIKVVYCAEQFENDGSPTSTIIKSVKRAMAGEFSRDLSTKVFKGQCKLIELGYRQGGAAGYGLRRMLMDQAGQPKQSLQRGEHKSLQTDRVILIPGPEHEVSVVRSIYQMFTREGKSEQQIAAILNTRKVQGETDRPWTRGVVNGILTNEKYIGNNVFNRISFKLKKKRVVNPPEMWVRAENAFDAVVDPESFYIARGIVLERNRRFTDEEMIQQLRELLGRHAMLTAGLIDGAENMLSSAAYRDRFGSLLEAYAKAGFHPDRDYKFIQVNRQLRSLHPTLVDDTIRQLLAAGATVTRDDSNDRLVINDQYTAAIVVSRCRKTQAGSLRWMIELERESAPDLTILVRMDPENATPADYYLLPLVDLGSARFRLHEENPAEIDTYRFDTLSYFVELACRVRIEVAA